MSFMIFTMYASLFIWAVPPLRQFKTRYFGFFMVLALTGPVLFFIFHVIKINANYFYPASFLFKLAFLVGSKKKYYILCLAVIAVFVFPFFKPANGLMFGIVTIIDLILFIIILHDLIEIFLKSHEINLFLSCLFVYIAIDMVKFFDVAINVNLGAIYYYFGVASQLLFGIAFWFVNVNTKNYKIKSKIIEDL
jgi:hypothetical protein